MVTVTTSPKVFKNISAHIVTMIQYELENRFYDRGVKATRKWQENVNVGGSRYFVSCHKISDDEVEITFISGRKKPSYAKSMKKEKRLRT